MRWVRTEEDELELELFRHCFGSVVELVGEREDDYGGAGLGREPRGFLGLVACLAAIFFLPLFSDHDCLSFHQLTVPKVKPGFLPSTTALALASTL